MLPETLVSEISEVLGRHDSVILAYLFGSSARGDTHQRSDIDLAVLFSNTSLAAYRSLWSDLHQVMRGRDFDLATLNGADPVFCFEVLHDGRPLFYRSVEELNDFERRTWQRYQDTRHLRAIGDHYLQARAQAWSSDRNPSGNASSDWKK